MSEPYLPEKYTAYIDVLYTIWKFNEWDSWANDNNIDICFYFGRIYFMADEEKLLFLLRFNV